MGYTELRPFDFAASFLRGVFAHPSSELVHARFVGGNAAAVSGSQGYRRRAQMPDSQMNQGLDAAMGELRVCIGHVLWSNVDP